MNEKKDVDGSFLRIQGPMEKLLFKPGKPGNFLVLKPFHTCPNQQSDTPIPMKIIFRIAEE